MMNSHHGNMLSTLRIKTSQFIADAMTKVVYHNNGESS